MAFLCFLVTLFIIGEVSARVPVPRPRPPGDETCTYEGKTYRGSFKPSACTQCHCERGEAMCMSAMCVPPSCVDSEIVPDECCPVCPNGENCYHGNGDKKLIIIKKGETYRPDAYTECHCPENFFRTGGPRALCIAEQKPAGIYY